MNKEQAIKLAESGWWKELSADVITSFQLFEERLCMPFGDFHGAVEKSLARPVWTHEFAYSDRPGGLRALPDRHVWRTEICRPTKSLSRRNGLW